MPYNSTTGAFTLLHKFGTGTANDNNFPTGVGLTLNDLATSISYTSTSLGTGSATVTPSVTNGSFQYITNNGAFTLAAPASTCRIDLMVTNGASAGTITFSGFRVGTTGDALDTVNGHIFIITIKKISTIATYVIKALQ